MKSLIETWRSGLEVGDVVALRHLPSDVVIVVQVTRTTDRMVCFWIEGRYKKGFLVSRGRELRIMRRDGLNYSRPKHWKLERPQANYHGKVQS
jgi:hypothetical protein